MILRPFAVIAVLGLLLTSLPVCAREPVSLPRTEKWVINYDNERCDLGTAFGEKNKRIMLRLTQFQSGHVFDLALYGEPMKWSRLRNPMTVTFGPGMVPMHGNTLSGEMADMPMRTLLGLPILAALPDATIREARAVADAVRYLDVDIGRPQPFRLELGAMAGPFGALEKCMNDLVRHWGYDVAQRASLMVGPKPRNPDHWITAGDYPTRLRFERTGAVVNYRLDVDESGAVTGCHIQSGSQPRELEEATCRLLSQRAKFDPALSVSGTPMKWYFISFVRWLG